MTPLFENLDSCKNFVNLNFERKNRNLICRKVRMIRKANLANFNYFCTFTYDNNLHTEESFRKKLKKTLANFASRKNWKYIGVWERSPGNNRLHFHGIFNIPKGTIPGELFVKKDYDTHSHKMQETMQSFYFNEKFGRSDFKNIEGQNIGNALGYIMKYIEKSGEKIVYSRGFFQYFLSDILKDDVVTRIGLEDKKLLLFDNFRCFDDGVLVGNVCPEVIEQMRKTN